MKPKLLLLDANVVIECYSVSVWNNLLEKVQVFVPSIVARDEAFYSEKGKIVTAINLPDLIDKGKIQEITADTSDFFAVQEVLEKYPLAELHDGELEALAVMYAKQISDYRFLTGDKAAIHAMCVLGLSEYGISLESILKMYGLQKNLKREFTEEYFKHHVDRGISIRLQNDSFLK